ncbi:MAG: BatD family protein [Chthoniobacterales bacterium]
MNSATNHISPAAHASRVLFEVSRLKALPYHRTRRSLEHANRQIASPIFTHRGKRVRSRIAFLLVALLLFIPFVHAENASVTANVSSTSTTADEPIRLTITVTGARNANIPAHIEADGLDINLQGKSQRFELSSGFGATMSTVLTYLVTPQKAGKFTIPEITLETGGQSYTTKPIVITVEKGAGGNSANSSNADDDGSTTPKIFAELLLPKDTAYVGEIVPVEVRFYFDSSITFQLNPPGQSPQIDGEGFSKLRFPQARLEQKTIKGHDFRVLIYQTSLVAAKSGDLTVGPSSLNFVVGMPQKRRQRSPFDDPFGGDPFANFFGNQRVEREMTLSSDPKTLHIKTLPSPRPAGFAGAVGQFTMTASAKPTTVKIGDPITYNSVISGRGNFDLVTAPTLASTDGWRTYPPTGKLVPTDEMGVSGDKSFDMAIIPERKAAQLPETSFVYFDPAQEKYITLKSPPISVQVEGQAIVAATPVPSKSAAQSTPTPLASTAESDLPPVKTALATEIGSFIPLWQTRTFWIWQSLPLLLLGALVWPKIAAALAPDTTEATRLRLTKEKTALATPLRSADPVVFFPAAARQLEITAALAGLPHASSSEILQSLGFANDEAETVREIFARRDELAYGGGRGGKELTTESLRRFQNVLSK